MPIKLQDWEPSPHVTKKYGRFNTDISYNTDTHGDVSALTSSAEQLFKHIEELAPAQVILMNKINNKTDGWNRWVFLDEECSEEERRLNDTFKWLCVKYVLLLCRAGTDPDDVCYNEHTGDLLPVELLPSDIPEVHIYKLLVETEASLNTLLPKRSRKYKWARSMESLGEYGV